MNTGLTTLFTGRHVTFLETVDSTNSYLSQRLSQELLPEGAVVIARNQTEGRGQANERWFSEARQNLLMSIVFYPSFIGYQSMFMLSKTFSLGAYDGIRSIAENVSIKWPNDIYIGDKKVAGILIENSIRNPQVNHSVLGLGINVNQERFPAGLPNPVSLFNVLDKKLDIEEFFCIICNALEKRYLQLKAGHQDVINEDYKEALYRFGQLHEFENSTERFFAKITAVADDGKLFLKRENGQIERYDFKEVRFVI